MKRVYFFIAFLCGIIPAYSQNHATCDDAIAITTPLYGPVTAKGWADSSLYTPNDANMYIGKKDKAVWFSMVIPCDTVLTFDIVPIVLGDDFDFLLFKSEGGDFCQKEKERQVKAIRGNFGTPQQGGKGGTGLSRNSRAAFVGSGNNSPYSAAVRVKKGEKYYLMVDNYITTKGGFIINMPMFNVKTVTSKPNSIPKPSSIIPNVTSNTTVAVRPPAPAGPKPNLLINVVDSMGRPVKASLIIDGVQKKPIRVNTSKYSVRLTKDQTIQIRANALGHMPYQAIYSPANDTSIVAFPVKLQPIKAASQISLEDIQFLQNSPNILPDSKPALDYVLQFLSNNQRVKIIIKGYVNDPDNSSSKKYDLMLSKKRTDAVKDYLVKHGIDKRRMKCVGFGSNEMLYPQPVSKEEQAANRRVEIEIQ